MKKFFMYAMAAVAMLSVSSCTNEEEMILTGEEGYGYISLNATADDAVVTRAAADITTFKAKVYNGSTYTWGTSEAYAAITSEINTKAMLEGTYTVDVRNYDDMDAALAANSSFGAPYWTGSASVTVVKATSTPVEVACGKPQNTKFVLDGSAFEGTALSLNVTAPRALTFTWASGTKAFDHEAYFAPAAELTYTLTYTINGITKTTDAKSLTMGAAGSAKKITVKSNTNGTISLTITTEDFDDPENTDITFDAATGAEV